MNRIFYRITWCFIFLFISPSPFQLIAQEYFFEGGFSIGNISDRQHPYGKSEVHLTAFKKLKSGSIGLDFSTGGNFIPGDSKDNDPFMATILNPEDTRFTSFMFLYRKSIIQSLFIEPRIGISSLHSYVHTDNNTLIRKNNLSSGLGLGLTTSNLTVSFRYQYHGKTNSMRDFKNMEEVILNSETISMILLRFSYHFRWSGLRN